MSSKAIYEGDGKHLLAVNLKDDNFVVPVFVNVGVDADLDGLVNGNVWLSEKVRSIYFYLFR